MKIFSSQKIITCVAAAIILFGAGWYAHGWYRSHDQRHTLRRVGAQGFRFTSPLLDVELPEGVAIDQEPIPFKHKILSFVQKQIASGQVREVSVYYRDLHDGPWFGINEARQFNPASMMKVPVMIAWLKRAEKEPAVLQRRMTYDILKYPVPEQYTRPALALTPGTSYSIDELLHYMMNYSDNRATSLLFKALSEKEIGDVLDNMDVNNAPNEEGNSLTAHGYSGFFRILYNAAYLSRELSEKALQLLSLQDFPEGIAAGVPRGTPVSAKFGEYEDGQARDGIQLHEFGIVYHPKHPYILGIMTQGHDHANQKNLLAAISRMIYAEVDSSGNSKNEAR